jgi:hypothetical protein
MSKHKTVMMKMIEWVDTNPQPFTREVIKAKATELLEIEKKQHGKTWDDAIQEMNSCGVEIRAWERFDDYFNETYESNYNI